MTPPQSDVALAVAPQAAAAGDREQPRYTTLDLLRLVAISMTLLAHAPSVSRSIVILRPFGNAWWLGVDLFMIISGWLLGGQLLREAHRDGHVSAWRFYARRWMRTLPPYYATLLLLWSAGSAQFAQAAPDLAGLVRHMTFVQQYVPPNAYMVSWSLCVEEHFYLVLPALVWAIMRRPQLGTIVTLALCTQIIGIASRVLTWVPNGMVDIPYMSHMRCDGLFLGLLLAWMKLMRPERWARLGRFAWRLAGIGVAALLVIMATVPRAPNEYLYVLAPTLGTYAFGFVFVGCVHESCSLSRISFRGLKYLGELTYAIYLTHDVIPASWLGASRGSSGLIAIAHRLALVVGTAFILHHLVERPALRLRSRWMKAARG